MWIVYGGLSFGRVDLEVSGDCCGAGVEKEWFVREVKLSERRYDCGDGIY
jgi:hypothetical protein